MLGLFLIQMLVFCATVRTSNLSCYNESDLEKTAERRLKNHYLSHSYPEPLGPLAASEKRCPVGEFAAPGKEVKDRSISPWRLVSDTDTNRFPRTLLVAQCLCEGCITIKAGDNSGGTENFTYNSLEVKQSRIVLRKEQCGRPGEGEKYHLVPYQVSLAVACICVKPK